MAAEAGEMAAVPEGNVQWQSGGSLEIGAFALGKTEVTKGEWEGVRPWANQNGYDLPPASGESARHPASCITWYDIVKFCNAASEMMGRKPVYYVGEAIFRQGAAAEVRFDRGANGFRLPTEAEWEYACRAGTRTTFFWGDEKIPWESNPYAWHTEYSARGDQVSPHPVGLKKPNAFGLHDMSGNVAEWCWDWYAPEMRGASNAEGPDGGTWRIVRGGSVALDSQIQSGERAFVGPGYRIFDLGFRIASSDPAAPGIEPVAQEAGLPGLERHHEEWGAAESAHRLFSVIDRAHPGLEKASAHHNQGADDQALAAYRDYFYHTQRAIPFVPEPRNADFGPRGTPEEIGALMDLQGRIAWCTPLRAGEPAWQLEMVVKDARKLLKEWEVTGDARFLRQWFAIVGQFARHAKSDFDAADNAGRATLNLFNTPITWDWGMGFSDARHLLTELRKIIYSGPDPQKIPARELADIVTFIGTDVVSALVKDSRAVVPNQGVSNARTLLDIAHKLPELVDAAALDAEGARRFTVMAKSTVMKDGGDLEQSLNYNAALPHYVSSVMAMLGEEKPPWLEELKEVATRRLRMLAVLTLPVGGKPSSGTTYSFYAPVGFLKERAELNRKELEGFERDLRDFPDPLVEQVAGALFADKQEEPAFTSIAFPYSGYSVMRDGWKPESAYLWFITSRPGRGHAVENINAFELTAFGQSFLTSGGATSYGNERFVEADQRPIIGQIDAYRSRSEARNTVLVDGKGQQRLASNRYERVAPYEEPLDHRWHTSEWFDLAEGVYKDGYGDGIEAPIEATHFRQIVFLRRAGLWIVTDRMESAEEHRYTACWNILSPFPIRNRQVAGFEDREITIDESTGRIFTKSPGQPNMTIVQAAQGEIEYERFHGNLDPARGWIAPGIGGRRYPKTDVWSSWKGAAGASQLVSAVAVHSGEASSIVSSKNLSTSGGVVGMRLELRDGRRVTWLSTTEGSSRLQGGPVEAEAGALLVVEEAGGDCRGIVLQAKALAIKGQMQSLPGSDFEFHAGQHGLSTIPVKVPTGFRWEQTDAGYVPRYDNR